MFGRWPEESLFPNIINLNLFCERHLRSRANWASRDLHGCNYNSKVCTIGDRKKGKGTSVPISVIWGHLLRFEGSEKCMQSA